MYGAIHSFDQGSQRSHVHACEEHTKSDGNVDAPDPGQDLDQEVTFHCPIFFLACPIMKVGQRSNHAYQNQYAI